ncbi:glycosyltransferase family A protein [Microbacterium sp. SD291]|uniref:glycosyltransferase family A protein n=1 Tax=Microbacterium sp. SD291 TaxID=2782007 RepID=UPI001A973C0E|nr:glycosyltransferase family A protein [Microbacterium sp. SD291]MBO0979388.1 glycosyltransferase family 2 protein [Microbacterium sp. SD291]
MKARREDEEPRTVDMIVAVHDTRRDIRRAIRSILADGDPSVRAFVVCHNLTRADVELELADLIAAHPGRIRIEECADGIPSPSGPFNFGLDASDADYVGIMGSDDELDRDAISQWRERAERFGADAVLAKVVRGTQRTLVRSPPKRLMRTGVLDFARDRLSYRSAPLGLMRKEAIQRLELRLLDGARNGGDLPFVTRLWLRGRVVAAVGLAAYVEHADAPVRVTHLAKPVREELGAVVATLRDDVVQRMSASQRTALATKLLRRNLIDSVRKRDGGRAFTDDDCAAMAEMIGLIDDFAPDARKLLSRAHGRLFDELTRPRPDLAAVAAADASSARYRTVDALAPNSLRFLLHPQAQPRFMLATASIKIGASRYFPWLRAVLLVLTSAVLAAALLIALLPR